jgi:predicted small integral membrane protein
MSNFSTTYMVRRSKFLVVFMAALFGITTLINNLTDYSAYAEYIGRIISMIDTTGNDSRRYRAISSTLFHHRFYWALITLETIFTCSFIVGAYQLYRKFGAPHSEFHEAKKYAIVGFITAIFAYQTFYIIILNEWFDLEYSKQINAFEWAQTHIEYMFFGIIYMLAARDT